MKKYIFISKVLFAVNILLQVIIGAVDVIFTLLLKYAIDIVNENNMPKFFKFIVYTVMIIIVMCILMYIANVLKAKYINKIFIKMKQDFYNGFMNMTIKDFRSTNSGEYISLLSNDMKILEDDYFTVILALVCSSSICIYSLIATIAINIKLFVILVILAIIPMLVPIIFGKFISKYKKDFSDSMIVFTNKLKDILNGYEIIKTFSIQKKIYSKYNNSNENVENTKYKFKKVNLLANYTSMGITYLTYFISLGFSGYLVLKNEISLGSMIASVNLVGNIVNPLAGMTSQLNSIKSTKLIRDKILKIIDTPETNEIGTNKLEFNDKITFENVTFSYDNQKPILKNVNLKMEKNKKYAIVGESGSGKSTLIKLLMKYNTNFQGIIKIDNEDIKNININSLNMLISLIQQDTIIFDGSIRDNITLYKEHNEEDLTKCISSVELNKLIDSLPNGVESLTGENGVNLSGGEKQRISLARALLKNSKILILDESTSALDNETAYNIEKILLNFSNLTLIVITHKLVENILKNYDEIIAIKDGEIIEHGDFYELINNKNYFYNLYYTNHTFQYDKL
ncbi:MAG: ABC transporter ATP-binding protein [Clostridium argentinense]|uniref:ABC transporter ATP-binding protein n=1 Tax=Clostridium faecium TaxID=2762223 RepID=A0ABR8YWU2_9CLOT|nr:MULTISPECIES: ABC transporter ATP-binding protein [Clostridium]MBD8048700.1 ABC transporter ATP-binding protein [Clostridium faecium]MBS5823759.1 ABC transporter ATP-binding protein [Clostridium argentinense]MDU1347913.1 ABC transporter ATP-binding protein [Clostridium argentinense]